MEKLYKTTIKNFKKENPAITQIKVEMRKAIEAQDFKKIEELEKVFEGIEPTLRTNTLKLVDVIFTEEFFEIVDFLKNNDVSSVKIFDDNSYIFQDLIKSTTKESYENDKENFEFTASKEGNGDLFSLDRVVFLDDKKKAKRTIFSYIFIGKDENGDLNYILSMKTRSLTGGKNINFVKDITKKVNKMFS